MEKKTWHGSEEGVTLLTVTVTDALVTDDTTDTRGSIGIRVDGTTGDLGNGVRRQILFKER